MTLKKQLIAGFIAGAVLVTGGLLSVNAAPRDAETRERIHQSQVNPEYSQENVAKRLSERFGVNESEVLQAFKNNVHPSDIDRAAMLSKLSGKSFAEVLSMKVSWLDVTRKLGVTEEQVRELNDQIFYEDLAVTANSDVITVKALMNEGYNPRDIEIAGYIAKQSNKDIRYVLSMRRINNRWQDVARQLGVKNPIDEYMESRVDDVDDDDDVDED